MGKKDEKYDFVIELAKLKEKAIQLEALAKNDEWESSAKYIEWVGKISTLSQELKKGIEKYEKNYLNR